MADFTPNARERIKATVRAYEGGAFGGGPPRPGNPFGGFNIFLAKAQETVIAGNLCTFRIMRGDDVDKGDEEDGDANDDVEAWVRRGACIEGVVYILIEVCGCNDQALDVFNPTTEVTCKTDASHAKSATGTVSIYKGSNGSETDTGVNITSVYNRFADVASTKWVRVSWNDHSSAWELIAAEC